MEGDQRSKVHVSIQKGFSIPRLQKCRTCCVAGKYHCPFCLPAFFKPAKLNKMKDHLENHLKLAFYIGESTIHRCGLDCRAQPHYHCLYCAETVTTKIHLTNHLPACIQAQQQRGLRLLELQLASGRSRRTAERTTGETDAPSNNMESEEDSDEMDVEPESQDRRSRSALPVVCAPNQPESDKCHQTVQTDLDKPQDCDEFYFMTLVKVFKKLSPWKKSATRMRIERLLFEAEFQ